MSLKKGYHIKALGQNLLVDKRVASKEVRYAGLAGNETVLEIGPGKGVITGLLVEQAGKVVAIEKDAGFYELCRRKFKGAEIIHADALKVDWPRFDKMVSNLPYSISSPLLFKLLKRKFELAVLVLQKEFAERMVAKPGDSTYGRLSVNAGARADVELLDVVPRGAFRPVPEVDSRIIRLRPKQFDAPPYFDDVVRALFQHRKKRAANALADSFHEIKGVEKKEAKMIAEKVCPGEKVFKLGLDDVVGICKRLGEEL